MYIFVTSRFSNPDLRRPEFSLDAVLQRTSSNSSSSSSPSSHGGSTERRGMRHARVQMHGHAAKQSETGSSMIAEGVSTRVHGGSFPGCQRDVVYLGSALIHLSDVPRCTSDVPGDGGEDIGVIETGAVGRVQQWVRERSTKCREETPKRGDNLKQYPNGSIDSNTGH